MNAKQYYNEMIIFSLSEKYHKENEKCSREKIKSVPLNKTVKYPDSNVQNRDIKRLKDVVKTS